jgi:hypothetical protein
MQSQTTMESQNQQSQPSPKAKSGQLRLEYRTPTELDDNPANWREHSESQMVALDELISDPEVGWAGACLYNERTGRLIDGHARKKRALEKGEKVVPVLIGSWSEEAEAKILATLDPIASMASTNKIKQAELLASLAEQSRGTVKKIFEGITQAGKQQVEQAKTETKFKTVLPAPAMTWVLLGLPTVRYGEIAERVQQLGNVPDILLETVSNGG